MDSSLSSFPDWVEVDFDGSKTINEIDVVTRQDDLNNPVEPTLTQTFSLYGITAFDVQYWDGSAWTTVSGGSITNNNKVWKQLTFAAVTTSKIRVVVNAGADNAYSRVVEVEAWGSQTAGPIKYVLSDIQGSTRAVMSNNGSSSAIIARHDYLPFGEEISAGLGLRTSAQGYGATDTNRQKYGLTERDDATGLDHTWWRKYENLSGRWTSPDPYRGSMAIANPQSFHRYNYTKNDPVNSIDPSGLLDICFWNIPTNREGFEGEPVLEGCIHIDGGFGPLAGPGGPTGGGGGGPIEQQTPRQAGECARLVAKMLKPLGEMMRLKKNYDPVKDYYGGYPIRKRLPDGRVLDRGNSKPGGHYRGLKDSQAALRNYLEQFKRKCLDRNDNSDPGLPGEAEEYAYMEIEVPHPNVDSLFDILRSWLHNIPPPPKQPWPFPFPPPPLPLPIPVPIP